MTAVISDNLIVDATSGVGVFTIASATGKNASVTVNSDDTVHFADYGESHTIKVSSGTLVFGLNEGKYVISDITAGDVFTITTPKSSGPLTSNVVDGDVAEEILGAVVESPLSGDIGSSVTYTALDSNTLRATDGSNTWVIQATNGSIEYGDVVEPDAGSSTTALIEISGTTLTIGDANGAGYLLASSTSELSAWVVGSGGTDASSTYYATLTHTAACIRLISAAPIQLTAQPAI